MGNVTEILNLLDKDIYTGDQLRENYAQLAARWGEWELLGNGAAGMSIKYIDIGNALFSGLMFTFSTLSLISLVLAIVLGKIVFPLLVKHYKDNSDEMVDLATLRSASQINEMSKNTKKKEWF